MVTNTLFNLKNKQQLKTMISHVHTCSIYIAFLPETEFSGSDRWGILQFQFTARCSADAVHVPEAERRPPGRKIPPEPPGPSRRRCESLALPMALGVRLPEEWIHMMVSYKNNRARYGAPVFLVCGLRKESWKSRIQYNNIVVWKIWSWT